MKPISSEYEFLNEIFFVLTLCECMTTRDGSFMKGKLEHIFKYIKNDLISIILYSNIINIIKIYIKFNYNPYYITFLTYPFKICFLFQKKTSQQLFGITYFELINLRFVVHQKEVRLYNSLIFFEKIK